MKSTVLLGISGGIAAVKAQELITLLKKNNLEVKVILTHGASEIVNSTQLQKETGVAVFENLFKNIDTKKILKERKVEHTQLAGEARAIVIAPATANCIAKLAQGIADDYLTTVVLAATCTIILCPSMNVHMWENQSTQENIQKLQKRGYIIIYPDSGMLSCGYEGQGRLAALPVIVSETLKIVNRSTRLANKKIIITSGATKEAIDDVRFVSNASTGKMGAALAESCFLEGAEVLLIRSKDSVKPRYNIPEMFFESAEDLKKILQKEIKGADVIFHAAAVSDFSIDKTSGKISSNHPITLTFIPKEKILSKLKQWNPKTLVIAFKAETGNKDEMLKKAEKRLEESQGDYIIANCISKTTGFGVDTNEVYILAKDKKIMHIPFASKKEIAQKIIDSIL